jgi:molybdenum cofactor cytidylyltransferase
MRPFVSGLVLAAGASTRLGQPKQLLPFGGTTLLGHVVSEARAAGALDEVVVVIGGAADKVRRRVDLHGARVVENPQFGEGCAASYRTGLGVVDPRAEAVVILLGDQPGVGRQVIDTVVEEWRRTRDRIMLASYGGREGHPLIFARALFERLAALHGDKAAWKIVDAQRGEIRAVPVDSPHPRDVNTREEYEALIRASAASDPARPGASPRTG